MHHAAGAGTLHWQCMADITFKQPLQAQQHRQTQECKQQQQRHART
jgi:hypothetical protein